MDFLPCDGWSLDLLLIGFGEGFSDGSELSDAHPLGELGAGGAARRVGDLFFVRVWLFAPT